MLESLREHVLKYVNYDAETEQQTLLACRQRILSIFDVFHVFFYEKNLFLHFATLVHDRQCCLQAPIDEEKTNLHTGNLLEHQWFDLE